MPGCCTGDWAAGGGGGGGTLGRHAGLHMCCYDEHAIKLPVAFSQDIANSTALHLAAGEPHMRIESDCERGHMSILAVCRTSWDFHSDQDHQTAFAIPRQGNRGDSRLAWKMEQPQGPMLLAERAAAGAAAVAAAQLSASQGWAAPPSEPPACQLPCWPPRPCM